MKSLLICSVVVVLCSCLGEFTAAPKARRPPPPRAADFRRQPILRWQNLKKAAQGQNQNNPFDFIKGLNKLVSNFNPFPKPAFIPFNLPFFSPSPYTPYKPTSAPTPSQSKPQVLPPLQDVISNLPISESHSQSESESYNEVDYVPEDDYYYYDVEDTHQSEAPVEDDHAEDGQVEEDHGEEAQADKDGHVENGHSEDGHAEETHHEEGHSEGGHGFNYKKGGNDWADKSNQCGGQRQSPIDIREASCKDVPAARIEFVNYDVQPESCTLTNTGHGVQTACEFPPNQVPTVITEDGQNWELEQLHKHWGNNSLEGSEHTINGKSSSLEIHFVHFNKKYATFADAASQSDGLLVVGVLFDCGPHNPVFDAIMNAIEEMNASGETTVQQAPQPLSLLMDGTFSRGYYTYQGSLTTPPCTENVNWIVKKKLGNVSDEQLEILRGVMDKNHRDPQPLNGRVIRESK